jgi:putative flippase GtrA
VSTSPDAALSAAGTSETPQNTLVQFARYLVVGGLAFAIDFGTLAALTELVGIPDLISAAIAFLVGLAANYVLSRSWVFSGRRLTNVTAEFAVFALIGLVGLGMNEGIIWAVSRLAGFSYLIGKIVSAGIVLIWNFGARKYFLFRN